jgi:hypothetical protein
MVDAGFRYDVVTTPGRAQQARPGARGCSSMAERQLPKLIVRVRFSSPAPTTNSQLEPGFPRYLANPQHRPVWASVQLTDRGRARLRHLSSTSSSSDRSDSTGRPSRR